ncbi:unnamed protein product [Polarella glacialis]|uniref:Uncharacterized protein n=1 Tax=Polarella glacialis TaxID=89957 RepID=A0A813FK17_POLGL|nr:unnamed protein product [Polarella glacialis]
MAHVHSPFERALAALPLHIFRLLLAHGYVGIQEDGELLKLMLDADLDKSFSDELVKSALALLPDDLSGLAAQEVATCIESLGRYAGSGKQSHTYTELECSLRGHCLNLENIVKLGAGFIPWTADKVRDLLNCCEEKKWTPSQVQRAWSTIKFLSGILGMLEPDSVVSLLKKKEAVSDSLVTALILPQHRAEVPALDLIMRMETGCVAPGPPADQYAMAFARKVVPLIAPLHSFTGIPWWETLVKFVKLFAGNNNFSNLDYLLPMVTKDRTGFIPRPMANSTGLRWIRTVLTRLGAPEAQVAKLTWPSFRVFFADWAFQAGITRDRRRYIGRWASEATADEYTREHRSVVCDIWNEVTPQTDKIRAGYAAPEDLNHKDYMLRPDPVAVGVPDPDTATNSAVTVPDAVAVGVSDPETAPSSAVTVTPTVLLPEAGLGNTVVSTATASANPMVGCGTSLAANDVPEHAGGRGAFSNLNEQGFQTANAQGMNACKLCFKFYTYPTAWTANLNTEPESSSSDGEMSSGSETDSENDSASEAEAFRPNGRLRDLRTWHRYVQPTFGPGLLAASARQAFASNVDLLHTGSNPKIGRVFSETKAASARDHQRSPFPDTPERRASATGPESDSLSHATVLTEKPARTSCFWDTGYTPPSFPKKGLSDTYPFASWSTQPTYPPVDQQRANSWHSGPVIRPKSAGAKLGGARPASSRSKAIARLDAASPPPTAPLAPPRVADSLLPLTRPKSARPKSARLTPSPPASAMAAAAASRPVSASVRR